MDAQFIRTVKMLIRLESEKHVFWPLKSRLHQSTDPMKGHRKPEMDTTAHKVQFI